MNASPFGALSSVLREKESLRTALSIFSLSNLAILNAKYKDYLRWDFYIPSENLLIEYNGRQHYEFVTRFYKSLMDFREDLERDILKKKYSELHHIN